MGSPHRHDAQQRGTTHYNDTLVFQGHVLSLQQSSYIENSGQWLRLMIELRFVDNVTPRQKEDRHMKQNPFCIETEMP